MSYADIGVPLIRTGVLLAGAIVSLAVAAPAQAALDARGELERSSPTNFNLTVRNTGDVDIGFFTWQSQPGYDYAPSSSPGASCSAMEAGIYCDGFVLQPGYALTVGFTAAASYPDGVPGFLLVSSPDESQAAGPLPVSYVADGGPVSEPVIGQSALVERLNGAVRVRTRGSKRFVKLTGTQLIPDGSEIDTTRGKLRLIVAAKGGGTETAVISDGRTIIDQNRAARPTTTLKLSEPLDCGRQASRSSRGGRRRGLKVTTDGGRIRTRGRFATATASGTAWSTTDRCDSTRIGVSKGALKVRDLLRGRTISVRAPGSYTAAKKER